MGGRKKDISWVGVIKKSLSLSSAVSSATGGARVKSLKAAVQEATCMCVCVISAMRWSAQEWNRARCVCVCAVCICMCVRHLTVIDKD